MSDLFILLTFLIILKEIKLKLEEKIARNQSEGGESMLKTEEAITKKEEQNTALKAELSTAREELAYEKEKQRSTEAMLTNLSAGQGEIVAR